MTIFLKTLFIFFAKPNFIYFYLSRNETSPINTNKLGFEVVLGFFFFLVVI